LHVLKGHEKFVTCLSRGTGDPRIVFSGGEDAKVFVWNIVTGQCLRKISRHKNWVTDLYVDNDLLLFSACRDGMLRVFNIETGEHIRTLPPSRKDKEFGSRPQSLALLNGNTLLVAEEDGRVRGLTMLL
jgi:WD40 repeat protein